MRIRIVIEDVLSNQPARAAPATRAVAANASRCSGLAPYSRRKRAIIGYTRTKVSSPTHFVQ